MSSWKERFIAATIGVASFFGVKWFDRVDQKVAMVDQHETQIVLLSEIARNTAALQHSFAEDLQQQRLKLEALSHAR